MKKSQVLATLALALAMGLTMPIASVFAAESEPADDTTIINEEVVEESNGTPVPQEDEAVSREATPAPAPSATTTVSSAADLQTAVNNTDIHTIEISGSFTVTTPITINRDASSYLTIDLKGNTISSDTSANARIFTVECGSVDFANGIIDASSSAGGIGIKVVGHSVDDPMDMTTQSNINVHDDVTIKAGSTDSAYGIAIYPKPNTHKATNTYVTLIGTIEAPNGACGMTVLGTVTDGEMPNIYVGGTINAADTGIYNAGNSYIYVGDGASITGATGITMKAGSLYVSGATVKGTGAFTPAVAGTSLNNNGAAPTGAGVQVESNGAYAGNVSIIVNGDATIESANGPAIYGYGDRENHEAVKEITLIRGARLVSGGDHKAIDGVADTAVEWIVDGGQGGEDKPADKKATEKAPGTGVVAATENSAQKTASVMAAIATALTVAGTAVVIRRNALCNAKKN